jgi:hypothetical protein
MNKLSFLDELMKLGGAMCLVKRAEMGDVNTVDIPHGMMGSDPMPAGDRLVPDDAATRLPATAHLPSRIQGGSLGGVTQAKDPIDREKYNRAYRDRR